MNKFEVGDEVFVTSWGRRRATIVSMDVARKAYPRERLCPPHYYYFTTNTDSPSPINIGSAAASDIVLCIESKARKKFQTDLENLLNEP